MEERYKVNIIIFLDCSRENWKNRTIGDHIQTTEDAQH